jgi:hypothetical protein
MRAKQDKKSVTLHMTALDQTKGYHGAQILKTAFDWQVNIGGLQRKAIANQ